MSRPTPLATALCFFLVGGSAAQAAPEPGQPFSAKWVRDQAQALSQEAYREPGAPPPALDALSYDQLRALRFRPARSLWRKEGLPFELQFLHLGGPVRAPVQVFTVSKGQARPVTYDPEMFDGQVPGLDAEERARLGFAGFRAHGAINTPAYFDEVVVFVGASYFRSLGRHQLYGLSARGLAIDTAEARGEEFPSFRSFWVEEPAKSATELVIHALLDSPSTTGAYRFVVKLGVATQMEVTAALFPRAAIGKVGVAPLTSMYLHGENDRGYLEDFRPEVHDSDGLLIWNGNGERLWRPLTNPARLRVSMFQVEGPKGFGLFQRDTAFSSYEDLEARYERRPSLWVEPISGFERGSVTLVEIPTAEEIHDNIAAFYTPSAPVKKGSELKLAYRLHWGPPSSPQRVPASEVLATRIGGGSSKERRKFVLDFSAPRVPYVRSSSTVPEALVSVSRGKVVQPLVQWNEVNGGYRATFELEPAGAEPIELRCFLKSGDETISETWSYLWTP